TGPVGSISDAARRDPARRLHQPRRQAAGPRGHNRDPRDPLQACHAAASAVGARHAYRAGHAGPVVRAVPVRVLVVRKILLVVVLSEVELGRGLDLSGDLAVARLAELLLEGHPRLFGGGALLVGMVEDRGTVLRPDVVPLAHALRGVV